MPTTATDARSLYECSAEFRAFIAFWDEHRRCPLPLVYFLLEQGMESQADCARWAATEPDRVVFLPSTNAGEREGIRCGPYPSWQGEWLFKPETVEYLKGDYRSPHRIPSRNLHSEIAANCPKSALLLLLDNWQVTP